MKRLATLGLLLLVAASEPDPYATSPKGPIETMLRAAEFGEPGADAVIEQWLTAHPQAPKEDRVRLFHRLCVDYGPLGQNALRAAACHGEGAATGNAEDDNRLAAALRDEPNVRAVGSTHVPLIANAYGNRSVTVKVGDVSSDWFFDTGAEVSVVSQSLADRIGVRKLEGTFQVGTTTAPVHGGMGIIPVLQIGEARVENLPVLILPDAQLTIGDLPPIPAILGLPAMVAFGRIAWLDHGKTLVLGNTAPPLPLSATRIYWHEEGLGIPLSNGRQNYGAFFDSGANHFALRAQGHALLDAATEASAVEKTVRTGGAGGIVERKQKEYPQVRIQVAGVPLTFASVAINEADQRSTGQIGDDLIAQLSELVVDFRTMRISARP